VHSSHQLREYEGTPPSRSKVEARWLPRRGYDSEGYPPLRNLGKGSLGKVRCSHCKGRSTHRLGDIFDSIVYMIWSEDHQKLTYRDLELSMSGLKQFARWQVEAAQEQLQKRLLIHDIVPMLRLQDLKDNPALNQVGQSFLTDPRNPGLQGYDRWLLNRVLKYDWLQDEFRKAIWRPHAV
jgi:hypothetical protein